jgi:enoyl-CoA hydratase
MWEARDLTEDAKVRCRRRGAVGLVTLNRPAALNALDLGMIRAMTDALGAWRDDPRVAAVVLEGAGRAFCAGGDIAVVHASAAGDPEVAHTLWREEYRLDALIARYPKPVVAFMDGITMGGGFGISGHAALRIATERTVLAMPEVTLGLAPDVGGLLLFARAPGEVGTHLALTGARIGGHDAVYCGFADHVVDSARLPALLDSLVPCGATPPIVNRRGVAELARHRPWIDACYTGDTVESILDRLHARPEPAAHDAARSIEAASPTAVKVTLRAVRAARSMSGIEECLRQDFRLCSRFLRHPDLREGIRAAIIDKDRAPRWDPALLAAVTPQIVAEFFVPLDEELALP